MDLDNIVVALSCGVTAGLVLSLFLMIGSTMSWIHHRQSLLDMIASKLGRMVATIRRHTIARKDN